MARPLRFPHKLLVGLNAELIGAIDDWRRAHPDIPTRSEAIRLLAQSGLRPQVVQLAPPSAGDSDSLGYLRQIIQAIYQNDGDPAGFVLGIVEREIWEASELVVQVFAELLGLPRDPWPGLTIEMLDKLTKGRKQEARNRGIRWVHNSPLDPALKLRAYVNRDWLLATDTSARPGPKGHRNRQASKTKTIDTGGV